ncbi:hypothetical protein, partial [Salmonella sp. s51228]|uniref:hypothetical protein n=1 Tax=Salmonella sp. s51228 TaxID=3159652 RepID=UPI003980A8F3
MARQIGKMLNTHPPKLVSGPEILNKYVGESEAAVRRLFEDASLSTEFSDIFRRAFSSRVFPPDMIEKMGLKHVKGILL